MLMCYVTMLSHSNSNYYANAAVPFRPILPIDAFAPFMRLQKIMDRKILNDRFNVPEMCLSSGY